MDEYNRNIDSIGTEISYSATSDMPSNLSDKQIQQNKKNINNHGLTVKSQAGGEFLDFLFENDGNKSQRVSNTDITRLIMNAIETDRYQAADFLLEQYFIPDMEYQNRKKENLIHALINARNKMTNADKALAQLISGTTNKEYLNRPDINGMTPFYTAIRQGHNDIAQHMERHGAKKITPSIEQMIMSEYESERPFENEIQEKVHSSRPVPIEIVQPEVNYAQSSSDSEISQKRPSIFSKQSDFNPNTSKEVADIVKGFRTRTTTSDPEIRNIIPSEYMPESQKKTAATKELDERIQKLRDMMNKAVGDDQELMTNINTKNVKKQNQFTNPLGEFNYNATSNDQFVKEFAEKIIGKNNQINESVNMHIGGARKSKRNSSNTNAKVSSNTDAKVSSITGTRLLYKLIDDDNDSNDMFGGMSETDMRKIARAVNNQKDKLHEESVEKILAHLPKKDMLMAQAIKAIIYNEVKEKHKEMSGLDRAAEMMRVITKNKVDEIIKNQKDNIKKIQEYLEHKQKTRSTNKDKNEKLEMKSDKKNENEKKIKRPQPDFESSVSEVSDYDSSDESQ